jgi:hypothetical protein
VAPLHIDGASSPRAGTTVSSTTGSAPRLDAAARARATELAAAFTAQIEQSMMDSLAQLSAADEDETGNDDGGFSGIDGAAAGVDASVDAGAGDEASLAQQLLATVNGTAAAGASAGATTVDAATNAQTVASVAQDHGVDPVVAVAMMLVESGGNNRAIGDGGTSFGLFQLHEGGMLTAAGLSSTQAFDPTTNAQVALRSYAHEHAKGHATRTPGQIAAASQRPADPVGYAAKVDAMMARARAMLA